MTERRLVRCQYNPAPHPLDDECVNVTDVWTDAELEARQRRVLAATDGPPPAVTACRNSIKHLGGSDA